MGNRYHDSWLHGKLRRDSVARTRERYDMLMALVAEHELADRPDRSYLSGLKARLDICRKQLRYKNAL